jgi:hypothetical protein
VAYGWVAASEAAIGELDVAFHLADADRYLRDFKTLPAWRWCCIMNALREGGQAVCWPAGGEVP